MKGLIAEDDFTSRRILKNILDAYGRNDTVINGEEAVEMFKMAWEEGDRYDLVCLDINMPQMDGHTALKKIREYEELMELPEDKRVKIIMTTSLDDFENINTAFKEQCEGYIIKPVERKKIEEILEELELINQ